MSVEVKSYIDFNNGSPTMADMSLPFNQCNTTFRDLDLQNFSWENFPFDWKSSIKDWEHTAGTSYELLATETASFQERLSKLYALYKKEKFSSKDNIRRSVTTSFIENLNIAEFYWDYIKFYLQFLENLKVRDVSNKAQLKSLKDGLRFVDLLKKASSIKLSDKLHIADVGKKNIKSTYKEIIHIADSHNKKIIGTWCETLQTSDYKSTNLAKTIKEYIFSSEFFGRRNIFSRNFNENLGLTIDYPKTFIKNEKEELSVNDSQSNVIGLNKSEQLHFDEQFIRIATFKRLLAENANFGEYISKGVVTEKNEKLHSCDAYIRASDGIISNMSIKEHAMSFDAFQQAVNQPPNFTKFMEFKVGEYEYQEALVRLKLQTQIKQVQPTANAVTMYVDIEDVNDSGVVQIVDVSAPTKVYYNKHYYKPPEVSITLRGANMLDGYVVPYLVDVFKTDDNGTYFEVELLDSNYARKKGTINWVAKGY